MDIVDRVYGDCVVDEPVLVELIASNPVQRLNGISQSGATRYFADRKVTRYEHCVGVMLLLRKLGASVEEQIAGLLHDVPHTAFSHVIDYVFTEMNETHEWHEQFLEKILRDSDIPQILLRYGYSMERILDERNFPLLERKLPDLCADRIDYTLRDHASIHGMSGMLRSIYGGLMVCKDEILVKDEESARALAETYLSMELAVWSNPREVAGFQVLADAIRIGLEKGILKEDDLFHDDRFVYSKLQGSDDVRIQHNLAMLNPRFQVVEDPLHYDMHCRIKLRYVDPKFIDGSVVRASERYPELSKRLDAHKRRAELGLYLRIVGY
jgi:uncharacterized protein